MFIVGLSEKITLISDSEKTKKSPVEYFCVSKERTSKAEKYNKMLCNFRQEGNSVLCDSKD